MKKIDKVAGKYLKEEHISPEYKAFMKTANFTEYQSNIKCCDNCSFVEMIPYEGDLICKNPEIIKMAIDSGWNAPNDDDVLVYPLSVCPRFKKDSSGKPVDYR